MLPQTLKCLLAIVLLCGTAKAQIGRATIFGTVRDQQDSLIVGADVTITHTETNTVYKTQTNQTGSYTVPGLPVGTYQVAAEIAGFKRSVQSGIVLQVDDRPRVDFRLEVGAVLESVQVMANPTLVDTAGATVGKVIENARMTNLPLNGRSALSLVVLTPNVRSHTVEPHGFGDRGALVSAFSVNGGPLGINNVTLDGTTNVNPRSGDVNVNPAVDAIEEFKVQSGVMSAEYSFTAGGVVNMVTKSGTNEFHGSLYEFVRNDKLDARNAFAQTKAPFRYNQYGGAIGGPIRRDRTFFFFNFEEWRFRRSYTTIGTVPTAEERRGDFSQLRDATGNPILIYDPQTTEADSAGGFRRSAFTGNIIPSNRLDRVAQNILPFYPLPNQAPTNVFTHSNNFQANLGAGKQARQLTAKIDQQFSTKNHLSLRYTFWDHEDDQASTGNGYFPDRLARVRNDDYTNHNYNLSDSHFISPRAIHDFRFGVVRQRFFFASLAADANFPQKLGLPGTVPGLTIPIMSISGIPAVQSFPAGFAAFKGLIAFQTFQLTDSLTLIRGQHTIKFGAEFRQNLINLDLCSQCSGTFRFDSRLTGNPQRLAGTGSGLASFLLGTVAGASVESNVGTSNPGFSQGYYIQDDWKVTRRLTLNLGLRYDYQQVPGERHNGLSNFNPFAADANTGLLGRMEYAGDFDRTVIDADFNDFSPRFGFAFDALGTGKTVVRGGYGMYYPWTVNFAKGFSSAGFRGNVTTYEAPGGNLDFPAFQLQDGFPFAPVLPRGSALGPSAFLSQNVGFDERGGRTPYSQQFSLTVQQELPGRYLLEAGYSGNRGVKMLGGGYDFNQLDPQFLSLGRSLLDRVPNPFAGRVPGAFGGSTITRQQLLRPYPYYNRIGVSNPHMSSSIYHSFLLSVERRMSSGLVFLGSYTFGKLINDGVAGGFTFGGLEQDNVLDYQNGKFDRRSERAVDSIDSASRFVFSGIYELPFGTGKRWPAANNVLNSLISGWQIDGVLTLQGGLPLVVRGANNFLATRPNSTGASARLDDPTASRWFDTTQFVNPPDFTYGNASRTLPDVRTPGINNMDFSLIRNTRIRESLNLQFRAESFNFVNHVNLRGPDARFVPGPSGRNQSGTFGTITAARDARIIQLGLKMLF